MTEKQSKTILVLDTSWLMDIGKKDYNVLMDLLKPPEVEIRIHNRVFKELDGLKNVEEKSLQARRVSKFIEEALSEYKDRVQISDFGIKQPAEKFASTLQSEVDAIVLTLAEMSEKEGENYLLTFDKNQKLIGKQERIKIKNLTDNNNKSEKKFSSFLALLAIIFCIPAGYLAFLMGIVLLVYVMGNMFLKIVCSFFVSDNKGREPKKVLKETTHKIDNDDEDLFDDDVFNDDLVTNPAYNSLLGNIFHD